MQMSFISTRSENQLQRLTSNTEIYIPLEELLNNIIIQLQHHTWDCDTLPKMNNGVIVYMKRSRATIIALTPTNPKSLNIHIESICSTEYIGVNHAKCKSAIILKVC